MIVIICNVSEIEHLHSYLAMKIETKDLEILKYFLCIETYRYKQGLFISQWMYILDLFVETGNSVCAHIDTPIEVNHDLTTCLNQILTNKERYPILKEKLIYCNHTQTNLSYAISIVSDF